MARKEGIFYQRIQSVLPFRGTSTRKFIGFVALGLILALMFVPVSTLRAIGAGTERAERAGTEALPLQGMSIAGPIIAQSTPRAIGAGTERAERAGTEALPLQGMSIDQKISQSNTKNLIDQGKEYYYAGRFEEAAEVWQAAVYIYSERGDRLNQALALSYLSLAYQKEGKWQDAEEAIAQCLGLLPSQDATEEATPTESQRRVRALALNNQGLLFLAVGKAKAAFEVWEQAAIDYQALAEAEAVSGVQLNQALALEAMGYYRRSCDLLLGTMGMEGLSCDNLEVSEAENEQNKSEASDENKTQLEQVQELFAQEANSVFKATGLRSLGNVLRAIGSLKESELILKDSLTVAQSLNISEAITQSKFELGNTYQALAKRYQNFNEVNQTKDYREESLNYYIDAIQKGSPAIALSAIVNQLSLLLDDGINELIEQDLAVSREEAKALLPKIEILLNSIPVSQTAVKAKINLSCTVLGCDRLLKGDRQENLLVDLSQIDDWLNTAVEEAEQLGGDRLISYALGTLAKLYEYQLISLPVRQSKNYPPLTTLQKGGDRNYSQAKELTQSALNLAEKSNAPDIAYQWQWQMGRLIEAEAEVENLSNIPDSTAVSYYSKSLETLQTLRQDMAALNSDIQFNFRDRVEPVYRQYVDLLLRPEKPPQEDLETARQTIENLQLAELDNFFQDACVKSTKVNIDEVIDQASESTALIYTIFVKNRLEVIFKLPKRELRHFPISTTDNNLESILQELKKDLNKRHTRKKVQNNAETLYNLLIKPIKNRLNENNVTQLVFVLDDRLRNIPMSVLYDGDGEEYLIQKYAIAVTPGLRLLGPKPPKPIQSNFNTLAAGISEAIHNHTKLEKVDQELQNIQQILPTKILRNEEVTSQAIQNNIASEPFSIIHMATHANFSSNPEKTYILFFDGKFQVKKMNNLLQGNQEVKAKTAELLVLSACETATGDPRSALGLAGVAIRAGAGSTLAGLWKVNDQVTMELITHFYRKLTQEKVTKAQALQSAQIAILNSNNPDWKRPYKWAPYVLIGNWI